VRRRRAAPLVMISTTLVYGAHPKNPNFLTEESELRGHRDSRFVNDKVRAERQSSGSRASTPTSRSRSCGSRRSSARRSRHVHAVLLAAGRARDDGSRSADAVRPRAGRRVRPDQGRRVARDRRVQHRRQGRAAVHHGARAARRVPVPMPQIIARQLSKLLWATQLVGSPPSFLDFLLYLCVADGAKARRELGFAPGSRSSGRSSTSSASHPKMAPPTWHEPRHDRRRRHRRRLVRRCRSARPRRDPMAGPRSRVLGDDVYLGEEGAVPAEMGGSHIPSGHDARTRSCASSRGGWSSSARRCSRSICAAGSRSKRCGGGGARSRCGAAPMSSTISAAIRGRQRAGSGLFEFLYSKWFRVEASGLENIRRAAARCSSRTTPARCRMNSAMVMHAVRRDHPSRRDVRPLVEDTVFHLPFLGRS